MKNDKRFYTTFKDIFFVYLELENIFIVNNNIIYMNRVVLTESELISENLNYNRLQQLINECVGRCLKFYLEENLIKRKVLNEQQCGGCIVYRGMNKGQNTNQNVWVSDSEEYASYWAKQEYNKNGVVLKYFLPNNVISDLCNLNTFEEIMSEYNAWQEISDDSTVWDNCDDEYPEYDVMHDLCFPSKKQISILKREGYKGLIFKYTDECYSILVFDGRNLKKL